MERENCLHLSIQQEITDIQSFQWKLWWIYCLSWKSGFDVSKCSELEQVLHSADFFDKPVRLFVPHIKERCNAKMDYTEPVHYVGAHEGLILMFLHLMFCRSSHEYVWDEILSETN